MFEKLLKLVMNPGKYLPMVLKRAQQPLCRIFTHTAFFMQGQMDINPGSRWYNRDMVALTGGLYPKGGADGRKITDLDPWDNTRRDMMILLLRSVIERQIAGDLAEVGVFRGATARLMHQYCPERRLHLFDTFEGFTDRGAESERAATGLKVLSREFSETSVGAVLEAIRPKNGNVIIHEGYFPESVPADLESGVFAFVHLDADLYEPTRSGLEFFFPRMSRGGMILIHDYNAWPGARKAVDDYFAGVTAVLVPMPDKSGSILAVKTPE